MSTPLRIAFVSDVACPWCAVGLHALERALETIGDAIPVELRFEPFELNPGMVPDGEDASAHLAKKYGLTQAQLLENRERIRARGADVGFAFGPTRSRVWNTFDAHRLLHWAGTVDLARQRALKHALLAAYHGRDENPGARDVLLRAAAEAGLDAAGAAAVVDGDAWSSEVRARERHWQELGIHGVPATVIDDRHLLSGGQPPEVFEQALRRIAAERTRA
jgi:predicted DsbA family dithiol-disulfide isomerase